MNILRKINPIIIRDPTMDSFELNVDYSKPDVLQEVTQEIQNMLRKIKTKFAVFGDYDISVLLPIQKGEPIKAFDTVDIWIEKSGQEDFLEKMGNALLLIPSASKLTKTYILRKNILGHIINVATILIHNIHPENKKDYSMPWWIYNLEFKRIGRSFAMSKHSTDIIIQHKYMEMLAL